MAAPNTILVMAGISGIAAHITLYRHGEWDVKTPKIVFAYTALFLGAVNSRARRMDT